MQTLSSTSTTYFYPRPPRGGRLDIFIFDAGTIVFLSTPSARRATGFSKTKRTKTWISIHALREEGDERLPRPDRQPHISIHALREEGDGGEPLLEADLIEFLSTPSARRATQRLSKNAACDQISIHALREEGDVSPP